MLKLKRVELQGFKSFCDRTELKFAGGGIAAVVGPNGCGKSNLSDAISWVLGEQSAKTLRGARMEDVIFAGARDRKPLGMASVTMSLVDAAGTNGNGSGSHGEETTITRRLYRSGESEYLINGHAARLRDIQDIFMGSGLGPESYAIIEQGRIGLILSSRPQDRRAVIEEAAGITKFKTRKRLSEAKLESAKQNLARVFDILEEVTRQVNSLKRQAAKARRYVDLKTELESRLRLVLAGRYRLLGEVLASTEAQLNQASSEVRDLADRLASEEQEHSRKQALFYETEKLLTAARARLAQDQVEAERTRGRLDSQVQQSAAIEQRITQAGREAGELDVRLAQIQTEISVHRCSLEELEAQIAAARDLSSAKNKEREALQDAVRQREKTIESGRLSVLRLMGEVSALRNQLAQIDEYLAGIERETSRSEKEEQGAEAELERIAILKKELSQNLARRQHELEAVASERRRTEENLAAQRQQVEETRSRVEALRNECSTLQGRKASLEDVLAHRSYTTDSVKRLFAALDRGKAQDFRPLGVLADFVEVDPVFEKSAEEFLRDELEYVVVENWGQASRGLDLLRSELDGRATFLVHPEETPGDLAPLPEPAVGPETGLVGRLSESLRLTNGLRERATELLPRVSRCFLAADHASARSLAVSYPHLHFLLADGVCYHGHTLSGGKKSASGPLALKREARELAISLQSRQRELEETVARLEELAGRVAVLEGDLERLRGLQQEREKDSMALEHDMRKLSEELSRSQSRLSVVRLELERLKREAARSLEQRQRNLQEVEQKESLRAQREQSLDVERQQLEEMEAAAAQAAEEHSLLRVELAGLEERHRGERAAMARLESQHRETALRHSQIAPEIEGLEGERARLLADNEELERKSAQLAFQMAQADAETHRLAWEEADLRDALHAGEATLKQLREDLQALHQKRSQIELELVKRQAELGFLDETSRKELSSPIAEVAQSVQSLPDSESMALAEEAYQEIRTRMDALGPVNPQALEEYQEAQQRHDFLSVQRQDLLDSIRDTEKAIQDIDRVSRQKFAEAFEAINQNFRDAFRTLFGGGMGEMRLTDESNVAESGIDIVASPPGKRLQNVLLLSGGEKSLAAMALLMAIFRYQPSPFCVLDEVDAPLDEANIERLMQLLKEMARQTQFLIITHSKRTMESAQTLYGVTMQEPGVSKLVSVRFEPATEALPA